jgi:hypothetical protein
MGVLMFKKICYMLAVISLSIILGCGLILNSGCSGTKDKVEKELNKINEKSLKAFEQKIQ